MTTPEPLAQVEGGAASLFKLKQFAITQAHTAMKVGTDAIALGSWVASLSLPEPRRVLDVGAGTAILALMMAQRYPSALIDAIELDAGALLDAEANIARSPWAERVCLIGGDFLSYRPDNTRYDLIISNPPYFAASCLSSPDRGRTLARREKVEGGLGLSSLIAGSRSLLAPRGMLCLVCPEDRIAEVRLVATEQLMCITHLCQVASLPGQIVRYLVAMQPLVLTDGYVPCLASQLTLRDETGSPSAEYRALTQAYLLG